LAKKNSRVEIRLLPPQRVPLAADQYAQAVDLLAELLLDVAVKRRLGRSGGVIASVSGSAMGSDAPFPQGRRKLREAA
jgi:hypothetical protein